MRVKMSKPPPTRSYCKRNRPLPYCIQNCRTPRHWKFTQHHRTTRPPVKKQWVFKQITGIILFKNINILKPLGKWVLLFHFTKNPWIINQIHNVTSILLFLSNKYVYLGSKIIKVLSGFIKTNVLSTLTEKKHTYVLRFSC